MPKKSSQNNLCKWGEDLNKTMPRSLQKYLAANPLCKKQPEYQGFCLHHLPHKLKLQREYELTSLEKRQEYLDNLHSGMNVGDAYRAAGISFEAALEITNRAIVTAHYLERKAHA